VRTRDSVVVIMRYRHCHSLRSAPQRTIERFPAALIVSQSAHAKAIDARRSGKGDGTSTSNRRTERELGGTCMLVNRFDSHRRRIFARRVQSDVDTACAGGRDSSRPPDSPSGPAVDRVFACYLLTGRGTSAIASASVTGGPTGSPSIHVTGRNEARSIPGDCRSFARGESTGVSLSLPQKHQQAAYFGSASEARLRLVGLRILFLAAIGPRPRIDRKIASACCFLLVAADSSNRPYTQATGLTATRGDLGRYAAGGVERVPHTTLRAHEAYMFNATCGSTDTQAVLRQGAAVHFACTSTSARSSTKMSSP